MNHAEDTSRSIKILIVEDQLIIAAELSSALKNFNYEVVGIANTTAKAVSLTKEKSPDLVLMDIMLKDGDDGIETALKLTCGTLYAIEKNDEAINLIKKNKDS